ncbi:hypothetical protein [Wenyingzhuangia sp. 2_MG-2023]|uniref:hypothetical protein n=1 Tax=Wenyingzhuangia sp. 2_MG-2023 TaxID=3062639 RepID=UPI0026E46B43|nr:hypothetical protein [Wenyingzhuangia sp. 2_MG-2023]MDO6739354.1 hypothetical protein [Wenyingzhuangia sp. 2_MG-2023]
MNTNLPIWFQVLKSFYENDEYHNGLTIPYLIGASTIISPEKPLSSINDVLTESQNIRLPNMIELLFCEAEEEFLLRIYDKENLMALEEFDRQYDNLIITDESLADLNIEQVINDMYMLYQDPINKGLYKNKLKSWCEYSSYDIKRITHIKN